MYAAVDEEHAIACRGSGGRGEVVNAARFDVDGRDFGGVVGGEDGQFDSATPGVGGKDGRDVVCARTSGGWEVVRL